MHTAYIAMFLLLFQVRINIVVCCSSYSWVLACLLAVVRTNDSFFFSTWIFSFVVLLVSFDFSVS